MQEDTNWPVGVNNPTPKFTNQSESQGMQVNTFLTEKIGGQHYPDMKSALGMDSITPIGLSGVSVAASSMLSENL